MLAARRTEAPGSPGPLPAWVDLADQLPKPADQGSQHSSVAWAAAYLKTYHAGVEGKWDIAQNRYQYSPAWVYNQLNGGVDEGILPSSALQLLVDVGADTMKFFPYFADSFLTQPDASSMARAARFKETTWSTLEAKVESLKRTLANQEPLLATFRVFPDFDELDPANPVYDDTSGVSRGRQAVLVVGYDDYRSAFRFINSWGTAWGDLGYGWLHYSLVGSSALSLATYFTAGGRFAPPPTTNSLYIAEGDYLWRVDNDFGDYAATSLTVWAGAQAIAGLEGKLYLVRGDRLYQVNPGNGSSSGVGAADLTGAVLMTSARAHLVIQQGEALWIVDDLVTGARRRLGSASYVAVRAIAADDDWLYVAQGGSLQRIDWDTGVSSVIGGEGWSDVTSMTALAGMLYLVCGDALWQIDPATGESHRLGDDTWTQVSNLAHLNGNLYVTAGGSLYDVDPTNGARQALGKVAWRLSPRMAALP